MPLTLMNHETPHHGCQMTPPSGQRPTAQIYFHDVETGVTTHVGPDTIGNGQQFLEDSLSGAIELSSIEAMLSMPGYTYRGAGTIDNLTFFAGSNQYPVQEIKAQWLDELTPERRAIELKKFPENFDFNQEASSATTESSCSTTSKRNTWAMPSSSSTRCVAFKPSLTLMAAKACTGSAAPISRAVNSARA